MMILGETAPMTRKDFCQFIGSLHPETITCTVIQVKDPRPDRKGKTGERFEIQAMLPPSSSIRNHPAKAILTNHKGKPFQMSLQAVCNFLTALSVPHFTVKMTTMETQNEKDINAHRPTPADAA